MMLAVILSLLTLTGPTGEVPWPQTQPSLVRVEQMDMFEVELRAADLIVGSRLTGRMNDPVEVAIWTPYMRQRSLSDHLWARGIEDVPVGLAWVLWCERDQTEMRDTLSLLVSCYTYGGRPDIYWISYDWPTMYPCKKGDLDCDGDIDQTDFGLLQARLGEMRNDQYDLDRDGTVTAADVEVFKQLLQGVR